MSRALLVLAVVACGCSNSGPKAEEFVPSEDAARRALATSLDAWKDRGPTAKSDAANPAVETADGLRTKDRTLLKYDILGPVPGEAARVFAVRLTLANPPQELKERYVVLGLDPLWVWRYDDFLMLTHWDHRMADPKGQPPAAKR